MKIKFHSKINILFVMMQMEMGGSERLIHNLSLKLDHNVFSPSIAWFHGDKILREFNDLNIPLYNISKIKRFDIFTMQKLKNIIKNNDIHIVNAHHFTPLIYSFYGCKIANHKKLVSTIHSEWEIDAIPWWWKIIGTFLLKHVDVSIGVSEKISKSIQNKFKTNSSKTFTIKNGINLQYFIRSDKNTSLKRKLGISNNEKVIGIVANFRKIKNHIFLLKVFNKLIRDYKNIKLLLIGQGFKDDKENTEPEIRNFINNNGLNNNVFLLGFRSDIPDILSIMDIFCLISFKEGLPISLIEAMAAGLPVVGTNVEGIREVIIPNKNGFLVDIGDVDKLNNVLRTLLNDKKLRLKLGQESKLIAKHTYSFDLCVKEYQDLFLSLMKKCNSRVTPNF